MITLNVIVSHTKVVCVFLILHLITVSQGYSNEGEWNSVNQDDQNYPAGKEPYLRCDTPVTSIQSTSSFFMFGGTQDAYSVYTLGDTWIYSSPSNKWTNITCASQGCSPAPRRSHSAAYVTDRNAVFVYGGYTFNLSSAELPPVFYGDLLEFSLNSNTWTAIVPLGEVPAPRADAALAYDPVRDRLILFGGVTYSDDGSQPWQYLNDTWQFDLDALKWSKISAGGVSMPQLQNNQAVYVSGPQAVFLYGGTLNCDEDIRRSFLGTVCISDTLFQFDCATDSWSQVETTGDVLPPLQGFVADNISSDQFFLHGGCSNYSRNEDEELYCTESQPDVFIFDTTTYVWTRVSAEGGPLLWYHGGGFTADSKIVLFGGIAGPTVYLNNFVWNFEFTNSESNWAKSGVIAAWLILGAVVIWTFLPNYLFKLWDSLKPKEENPETEPILIITEPVEDSQPNSAT